MGDGNNYLVMKLLVLENANRPAVFIVNNLDILPINLAVIAKGL